MFIKLLLCRGSHKAYKFQPWILFSKWTAELIRRTKRAIKPRSTNIRWKWRRTEKWSRAQTEWHTAGSVGWNFVIRGEGNQRVFGIQSDHSDGWTRTVSVCEWMYSTGTPSQSSVSQHFKPSTPTLSHFTSQLVLILFKLRQQFFLSSSPPLYLNMSGP